MSVSIHINGKPLAKVRNAMLKHIDRNEFTPTEELQSVVSSTESYIDRSQTKFNQTLFNDYSLKGDLRKLVKDELNEVNNRRKASGQRALRSDANVVGFGTLQLSDDTLEKIGYKKGLGYEYNNNDTIHDYYNRPSRLVERFYQKMVDHIRENPDVYGRLLHASLHFDETTPHVDFIVMGIDKNNPNQTMRTFLNGEKGTPKGQKLRQMQDDISSCFDDTEKEKYSLHRGASNKERKDIALKLRKMTAKGVQLENELSDKESSKRVLNDELSRLEVIRRKKVEEVDEIEQTALTSRLELLSLEDQVAEQRELLNASQKQLEKTRQEQKEIDEKASKMPILDDFNEKVDKLAERFSEARTTIMGFISDSEKDLSKSTTAEGMAERSAYKELEKRHRSEFIDIYYQKLTTFRKVLNEPSTIATEIGSLEKDFQIDL